MRNFHFESVFKIKKQNKTGSPPLTWFSNNMVFYITQYILVVSLFCSLLNQPSNYKIFCLPQFFAYCLKKPRKQRTAFIIVFYHTFGSFSNQSKKHTKRCWGYFWHNTNSKTWFFKDLKPRWYQICNCYSMFRSLKNSVCIRTVSSYLYSSFVVHLIISWLLEKNVVPWINVAPGKFGKKISIASFILYTT